MAQVTGMAAELTVRSDELTAALEVGAPWLDPIVVEQAISVVERAMQRLELGGDHTVVALVGATGSGKSSLFNALARMEIAQVGPRRPLTSQPMACIWGEDGSQHLLDWLDVPLERRMVRESVLDADDQAPLYGLVLLDLPDHDSTEAIHRFEVDRLVSMVDLLVWVVDPQKYADDALHSGYLQRMVEHSDVMVVVLNQIDRLKPDEAETCERDLRRLLDGDGLASVPMLAVSATRGDGVDDLRSLLAEVVADRSAITERIDADLRVVTDAVLDGLAPVEPGRGEPPGAEQLVDDLATAAGVPFVVDALATEYRRAGWKLAGWPMLRWLQRLSAALNRDRGAESGDGVSERDLKLITASLSPVSAPAQRATVELAVEATIAASADVLPQRWADAVRDSVLRPSDDLTAAVDEQVARVDLTLSPPLWWWLVGLTQYVLTLAAVVGVVWLFLIGVTPLIGDDLGDPVHPFGKPFPLLLLIIGLGGAAALAGSTIWALAIGGRRRKLGAQQRLVGAIEMAAHERVIVPIRVVLAQHRATRLALIGAGGRNEVGSARRRVVEAVEPVDGFAAGAVEGLGALGFAGPGFAEAGFAEAGNAGQVDGSTGPVDGIAGPVGGPSETLDLAAAERLGGPVLPIPDEQPFFKELADQEADEESRAGGADGRESGSRGLTV